jgi:hypothetical protein
MLRESSMFPTCKTTRGMLSDLTSTHGLTTGQRLVGIMYRIGNPRWYCRRIADETVDFISSCQ